MKDHAEPIYPFGRYSIAAAIRWADRHHFDRPKRAATILRLALNETTAEIQREVAAAIDSNNRMLEYMEKLRKDLA